MYLALVLSAEMLSIDSVARSFEANAAMQTFQKRHAVDYLHSFVYFKAGLSLGTLYLWKASMSARVY